MRAVIDVAMGKGTWADVAMAAVFLLLPVGGSYFKAAKKASNVVEEGSSAVRQVGTKVDDLAEGAKGAAKADDVGDAAKGAAKGPAPSYTQKSHKHVWARHDDPSQWKAKSKFAPGEGGQAFADEVYKHPKVVVKQQQNGRWQYVVEDMGRATGSRQGVSSSAGTLITAPDGGVITMYPGFPKGWGT